MDSDSAGGRGAWCKAQQSWCGGLRSLKRWQSVCLYNVYKHIPAEFTLTFPHFDSGWSFLWLLSVLYLQNRLNLWCALNVRRVGKTMSEHRLTPPLNLPSLPSEWKQGSGVKWCCGTSPPQGPLFPGWLNLALPPSLPLSCSPFCHPLMTDIFLLSPPSLLHLIFAGAAAVVIFFTLNGSGRGAVGGWKMSGETCRKWRWMGSQGRKRNWEKRGRGERCTVRLRD